MAYRCRWVKKNENNQVSPYEDWGYPKKNIPSLNVFPTGVGGILYPPNSLHQEVLNKSVFMSLAPTGDDIWFKAMSLKNNTKVVAIDGKFTEFPSIRGSQDEALWHTNVEMKKNDEQIKKVFDYYNLHDMFS